MSNAIRYYRGSIHMIDELFSADIPGLKKGNRMGLVISNDDNNNKKGIVTVAMITSRINGPITAEVVEFTNEVGEKNYVMCNRIHTVSKDWISGKQLGILDENTMNKVDNGIAHALNLDSLLERQVLFNDALNTLTKELIQRIDTEKTLVTETTTQALKSITSEVKEQTQEIEEQTQEIEEQTPALSDVPEKELERKRNRRRGYWQLEEHMWEFLDDTEKYDTDTIISLYKLKNKLVVYQLKNKFRKELGIVTKKETEKNEDNTD